MYCMYSLLTQRSCWYKEDHKQNFHATFLVSNEQLILLQECLKLFYSLCCSEVDLAVEKLMKRKNAVLSSLIAFWESHNETCQAWWWNDDVGNVCNHPRLVSAQKRIWFSIHRKSCGETASCNEYLYKMTKWRFAIGKNIFLSWKSCYFKFQILGPNVSPCHVCTKRVLYARVCNYLHR